MDIYLWIIHLWMCVSVFIHHKIKMFHTQYQKFMKFWLRIPRQINNLIHVDFIYFTLLHLAITWISRPVFVKSVLLTRQQIAFSADRTRL